MTAHTPDPQQAAAPGYRCACPPDAQAVYDDELIVTGHLTACVLAREPRVYTFQYAGQLHVGNFAVYAQAWRDAYESGEELSTELRTWDAVYQAEVKDGGIDHEGWRHFALTVGDEAVLVDQPLTSPAACETEALVLPGPDPVALSRYLTNSGDWTRAEQGHNGATIWRHRDGDTVAVPPPLPAPAFDDDAEMCECAAQTIAAKALRLDIRYGSGNALARMLATLNLHHNAEDTGRCRCGQPSPCDTRRALLGIELTEGVEAQGPSDSIEDAYRDVLDGLAALGLHASVASTGGSVYLIEVRLPDDAHLLMGDFQLTRDRRQHEYWHINHYAEPGAPGVTLYSRSGDDVPALLRYVTRFCQINGIPMADDADAGGYDDDFCWVCGDEGHLPRPACIGA